MKRRPTFTEWMQHIRSIHYANRPAMDRAIEIVFQHEQRHEQTND